MTGVRVRREPFGAIVYVPRRDHFFALDRPHTELLLKERQPTGVEDRERLRRLAELTDEPRAVDGRSLLGEFDRLPVSTKPLVVNCFTTAHCPLRCAYCHADDLMVGYRDSDGNDDGKGAGDRWLREVIRVAAATPAMVGVVTGGEPLARPDRAERLIAALAEDKAVVLDTSGVGTTSTSATSATTDTSATNTTTATNTTSATSTTSATTATNAASAARTANAKGVRAARDAKRPQGAEGAERAEGFSRLIKVLQRYEVHVRVSIDSIDAAVNDALRPINRRYLPLGTSAHADALDTVRQAVGAGLACSVQTVVTTRNGDLDGLLRFRDALVDLGVITWALHHVVPAGKAAHPNRTRLLGGPATQATLAELVRRSAADGVPIDIRLTSTHRAPNSTLLISARGELSVENPRGGAKIVVNVPRFRARAAILRTFREHVDLEGHASRYLNGTLGRDEMATIGKDALTPPGVAVR
jgi:MoaA/NifB/PqqE/SkfB family radical SAM enzyme